MNSIERVANILERKPVDRIAFCARPWGPTVEKWTKQAGLVSSDQLYQYLNCDLRYAGWLNSVADLDHKEIILEESDDWKLVVDGNGSTLKWMKDGGGVPEHVSFKVQDRSSWQEIKPFLLDVDPRRIDLDQYEKLKSSATEDQRYFAWAVMGPFELMHPACGHENLLMGMALDPEWIKDMVSTYVDYTINHLEMIFEKKGKPQALYFHDDLGYKQKPFMSTPMYKELIQPGHIRLFDFAHANDCKVILHSCGYIEPFVPEFITEGIDCLQGMEFKAGTDLCRLAGQYSNQIAFFGGMDARVLISNDKEKIDHELKTRLLPAIESGASYILHSDHSEPPEVELETMQYFFQRALELTKGK